MRASFISASFLFLSATPVVAQPLAATKALCKQVGMEPYSALNDDLGAGTIYDKLGASGPQSGFLKCQNVFSGLNIAQGDKIGGNSYVGNSSGSRTLDAGIGISFLKGIVDKSSDAKVDASLKRGNSWTVNSGPLQKSGVTQLRAQEYAFAATGPCANRIQKLLGNRKSITISLVYQTAGAKEIEYSFDTSSSTDGGLSLNIGPFVSITPKFKIDRPTNGKLKVSSSNPVNICYMKMDFKLQSDRRSGANRFILSKL